MNEKVESLEEIEAQIVPFELLCEECGTTLSVFDDECGECGKKTLFCVDGYYSAMRDEIYSRFDYQNTLR